jgi:hypothetical protein
MKTETLNVRRSTCDAHQPVLLPLRVYLNAKGDDLIACCGWLGGERWRLLAQSFVHSVLHGDADGPLQVKLLQRVHALLNLELIDDLDGDEAAIFADLDLNDPRVGNCCLHTEALAECLRAVGATDITGAVDITDAAAAA